MKAIAKLIGIIGGYALGLGLWANSIYTAWHGAITKQRFTDWRVDMYLLVLTGGAAFFWWKVWPHARRYVALQCWEVAKEEIARCEANTKTS